MSDIVGNINALFVSGALNHKCFLRYLFFLVVMLIWFLYGCCLCEYFFSFVLYRKHYSTMITIDVLKKQFLYGNNNFFTEIIIADLTISFVYVLCHCVLK